jgi:hypothetical protein
MYIVEPPHTHNRRIQAEAAHVIWLDNFSKHPNKTLQIPDIAIGAWQDCAWTGRALRECLVNVDMKLEVDEDGKVAPAMPDDIFERVEELKHLFHLANDPDTDQLRRYDSSLSHQLDVRTVPPKPEPDLLTSQKHKTALINGHDSLDNLHPGGIFKQNIGSNKGLLQLLRNHYEDEGQLDGSCEKYSAFVMDIDIFSRVIKVCTHTRSSHSPRAT